MAQNADLIPSQTDEIFFEIILGSLSPFSLQHCNSRSKGARLRFCSVVSFRPDSSPFAICQGRRGKGRCGGLSLLGVKPRGIDATGSRAEVSPKGLATMR